MALSKFRKVFENKSVNGMCNQYQQLNTVYNTNQGRPDATLKKIFDDLEKEKIDSDLAREVTEAHNLEKNEVDATKFLPTCKALIHRRRLQFNIFILMRNLFTPFFNNNLDETCKQKLADDFKRMLEDGFNKLRKFPFSNSPESNCYDVSANARNDRLAREPFKALIIVAEAFKAWCNTEKLTPSSGHFDVPKKLTNLPNYSDAPREVNAREDKSLPPLVVERKSDVDTAQQFSESKRKQARFSNEQIIGGTIGGLLVIGADITLSILFPPAGIAKFIFFSIGGGLLGLGGSIYGGAKIGKAIEIRRAGNDVSPVVAQGDDTRNAKPLLAPSKNSGSNVHIASQASIPVASMRSSAASADKKRSSADNKRSGDADNRSPSPTPPNQGTALDLLREGNKRSNKIASAVDGSNETRNAANDFLEAARKARK